MKRFLNDIKKYKDYIIYQTVAELKTEIVGSYLGWIWLFLEPLCFMLIYTFIAGTVFGSKIDYLPVFVFSGLTIWQFFNKTITAAVKIVVKHKDIVTKVYVPKFVLLLVTMGVNFFKLLATFGVLIIFMIIYQVPISLNVLYVIPLLILLLIVTFGFGTLFMHFGVYIEDLVNLTNIALRFVFYLTGIFYDIMKKVPAPFNALLAYVNPMAAIIINFRDALIYKTPINLYSFGVWMAIGLVLSIIGIRTIYKHENTYVKVMKG